MPHRLATLDLRQATVAQLRASFFETEAVDPAAPDRLAAIAAARPDLVVQDLRDVDAVAGLALTRALKRDPAMADVPLVVLLPGGRDLRREAFASGADEIAEIRAEMTLLPARIAGLIRAHGALEDLCLHAETALSLGMVPDFAECGREGGAVLILSPSEALVGPLAAAFGPDVRRAGAAPDARTILAERAADVLVLDATADPVSAFRTAAAVKGEPGGRAMRVLAVLPQDKLIAARRALEIGLVDAVAPAGEPWETAARLRLLLRRKATGDALRAMAQAASTLATRDELTGLHNRRYALRHLARLVERSEATGQPLALMTIDLDHLKAVNDRFGHGAGDQVLVAVARRLADAVRGADLLARIGGDEFLVAMPDISASGARSAAVRLRTQVALSPVGLGADPALRAGISVGIAHFRPGESMTDLIARSDRALYATKSETRARRRRVIEPLMDIDPAAAANAPVRVREGT